LNSLVCRVTPDPENEKVVHFEPWDHSQITTDMWQQLAYDISRASTLFPTSASVLARRCQNGYAAVAVFEKRIVSHIALAPIILQGGSKPTWQTLTRELHLDPSALPAANMYASASGWTAKEWRGRGINLELREAIYSRYLTAPHLGVGGMVGLAQPLLARLGWRILGWDKVPFVSSLVGIPVAEFPVQSMRSWSPPNGMLRYQGPHISLDVADHPWQKYIYLWVSDDKIAVELDSQIQTLFSGDLHAWRSLVADAYTDPEAMWLVAFLNC
jgi:hypothetical protein